MFAVEGRPTDSVLRITVKPENKPFAHLPAIIPSLFYDRRFIGNGQRVMHHAHTQIHCTSDTVFDTFPRLLFPDSRSSRRQSAQNSSAPPKSQSGLTSTATKDLVNIRAVAEAARALRAWLHDIMDANGWSLRERYQSLETPGRNRLHDVHAALDAAVHVACGMKPGRGYPGFPAEREIGTRSQWSQGRTHGPPWTSPDLLKFQRFASSGIVFASERYRGSSNVVAAEVTRRIHYLAGKSGPRPDRRVAQKKRRTTKVERVTPCAPVLSQIGWFLTVQRRARSDAPYLNRFGQHALTSAATV